MAATAGLPLTHNEMLDELESLILMAPTAAPPAKMTQKNLAVHLGRQTMTAEEAMKHRNLAIHLGRQTMTVEEAVSAAEREGLQFWTRAMAAVAFPSPSGRKDNSHNPDEFAYVCHGFGGSDAWHARFPGCAAISSPCDTAEEAALEVAREMRRLGVLPPDPEAVRSFREQYLAKKLLPTEWQPSAGAELLTLELAPSSKSGYKCVSYDERVKLKPYRVTLTGFDKPNVHCATAVDAAWFVAFCKKYKCRPLL